MLCVTLMPMAAHIHRFYIPPATESGDFIVLTGDEARRALRVVRLRAGERVALFDGAGREITGVVAEARRHEVVIAVQEERRAALPERRLSVLQAWLHRERAIEFLIEHGTELGVHEFVFFRSDRSERPVQFSERWPRLALEACKQSGRLWMPHFRIAAALDEAVRPRLDCLLVATKQLAPKPLREAVAGQNIGLFVGPEGDFSTEELRRIAGYGGVAVSLGPITFRAETAAILAVSLVRYELGELGPR